MSLTDDILEALIDGADVINGYLETPEENIYKVGKAYERLATLIQDRLSSLNDYRLVAASSLLASRINEPEIWEHSVVRAAISRSDAEQDEEITRAYDILLNRLPGDPKTRSRGRQRRRRTGRILRPRNAPEPIHIKPATSDEEDEDETGGIEAGA